MERSLMEECRSSSLPRRRLCEVGEFEAGNERVYRRIGGSARAP
jgi:hypothetical protein